MRVMSSKTPTTRRRPSGAGFGRPQSLARDAGAGGILKNEGIGFDTDGLVRADAMHRRRDEELAEARPEIRRKF